METHTDAWGIEAGFNDAFERWRDTPEATRLALRSAMGQEPLEIAEPWTPHALEPCPEPARAWGWAVQVYALRSRGSWGIGDLADLRRLGQWSAARGAGFLQISPLGATQVVPPLEASPYCPSSRRYFSPLYLRIEEVPGAQRAAVRWAALAERGHALNSAPLIDRDAVFALKMEALEALWAEFKASAPEREAFALFVVESGQSLREYAIHCALAESLGPNWKEWPPAYRHPAAPAVAHFAAEHVERIAFHEWIQWLLDLQLDEANQALPLMQDLPIGFDPGGADAWAWQDLLAFGASVGAPPDLFNTRGQDWGLPPFIPHRLKAAGYGPLRETIHALLKHAGGLRIDHVMGLFHLYWIPKGMGPDRGAFVRYDHEELLAVIAEECRRAGAFAVGEDLGTVDPWVRERLKAWGLLGSKVLWFESDPPGDWPRSALASVSTHDLPTLAGHLTGRDRAEQASLGLRSDPLASQAASDR
ncbi:MAG: 4-alpha-glucanotransferase, partial [Fibrobacteres bacterium]|nr:4-alpha-glucanotransferase [Fibrobacterota bacterium]